MTTWLNDVKFDEQGLIPAIAQDERTGRVLMVAWMNREALLLTAQKKQAVYFSRSRQKLWHKGESSGHTQTVHQIRLDCDGDVIVLIVTQHGDIACHTGRESCFYRVLGESGWQVVDAVKKDPADIYGQPTLHGHETMPNLAATSSFSKHTQTDSLSILNTLGELMLARKQAQADTSYVASLYQKGINKILEKVGEEAVETIIAAKDYQSSNPDTIKDLIYETTDLWFHTIVMLGYYDLSPTLIIEELARRFGLSGIAEKAARQTQ